MYIMANIKDQHIGRDKYMYGALHYCMYAFRLVQY